ncbi:MAG: hypothetical protein ACAI35_21095 [Candidatus Methylacidiphilales bacterium]|nr:hypothetical protein [Candidatus Methylacidiphilales bacterium]
MKLKIIAWTSLLAVTLSFGLIHGATSAAARLGDNEKEITSAYGKPIDAGKPTKGGLTTNLYQRNTTLILVQFQSGIVVAEAYSRTDSKPLTNEQMIRFMRTNASGQFWDPKPGSDTILVRRDKKAEARYSVIGGRPTFWVRSL